MVQFVSVTNVFYVANVALQFTPQVATNSPMATLIPLIFVLLVGIFKELIADVKRWKEDTKTNGIIYQKLISNIDKTIVEDIRSD